MTQENKQFRVAHILSERAHDLLISHNFAQQQIGYIHTFDMTFGKKIAQRTLLEVEIAAAAKRKESSTSHHKYIAKASIHLHTIIEESIGRQVEDLDGIYDEVIGVEDAVPAILDILAVKSASVGRLEPMVNDLSWLGRDLVSLVNLPQYRKKSSKGTTVKVDTPALALRYLGLDNLQLVIPTFAMRHWMPHSTEPFSLMKRKLRDMSMSMAICAKELAPHYGVNEQHAFTLAMLLEIGKAALIRLYLRTFEKVWQAKVQIARNKGQKDLHTALMEIKPDPLFLRNLLLNHSMQLTSDIIAKMAFRYLPFVAPLEELCKIYHPSSNISLSEVMPMTQVLKKAYGYSQYLTLQDNQLIEEDEKQAWFSYLEINNEQQKQLAKCAFSSLQLTIL